jgi:nucleoid-associated protein YgaU
VAGDSLALLAWREYGDATAWRAIAEANGIDDPMALVPGTELVVPGMRGEGSEEER